ncbi:MAG: hypothetical protein A2Y12_17270 [Planctomycetes bacterium GWF2_42_9]|nr:MAG: hypothetical protein A2Y12_17270 [Planctomycetes bacterium GWF2_42_9]
MNNNNINNLRERILGCWLGKAIGGTLGAPFEGVEEQLNIKYYSPIPTEMVANDDLDLQIVWANVLNRLNPVRVDRHILAQTWVDHIKFYPDEYGVALRNIALGLKPPLTGSYDNYFINSIGAAIRSEIWACLAAGDPALAAAYAYEDACVDHAEEGIWAEVFWAAIESAAFIESNQHQLLETGLSFLPKTSMIRQIIINIIAWWHQHSDWQYVRQLILTHYGNGNFTDALVNIAFMVLGWLAGNGNFGESICIAVNCGMDTDCTGASLAALLGILNPQSIDEQWQKPIGRGLVLSPEIFGIKPPASIDAFTDLILNLRERLNYCYPAIKKEEQSIDSLAIHAELGFLNQYLCRTITSKNEPAWSMPTDSCPVSFSGTIVELDYKSLRYPTIMVKYKIKISKQQLVKIMFNTPEMCIVWIDGQFAFRYDQGGLWLPSFNRQPLNDKCILTLDAGTHEIIAAISRPATPSSLKWAIGVADARTNAWLPDVFERRKI